MSFFKKIDQKEWDSHLKDEAEKYNKKENEHVLSHETPLTADKLRRIATERKKTPEQNGASLKK